MSVPSTISKILLYARCTYGSSNLECVCTAYNMCLYLVPIIHDD